MALKPMLAIWRKCKNSEMIKPAIVSNKIVDEIFARCGCSIVIDDDIALSLNGAVASIMWWGEEEP
jgi:hypothetical protein